MGYSQPIHLLASSGYVGRGIGLPVLVGRNSRLDLSLVVTNAPSDATTSIIIESSAYAVREGLPAHVITWRACGDPIELTGNGSASVSLTGVDAFVRARYDIQSSDGSTLALSLQGAASCPLLVSAARTSAGVGPAVDLESYHGGRFAALVSAAPAGETLALTIERSGDGQSGWTTAATFASITAAGEYGVSTADLDRFVRVRWTPSASGSWTFGVSGATSQIFARARDRSVMGIRQAAIPDVSSDRYLEAFEAASATIRGDLTAFVQPLRQWDSDIQRACIALADWHLLTSRGEEQQGSSYRTVYDEWSLWLANVGGRVPGAAGRRIRPSTVIDSAAPERDGTRGVYKFVSDPPRDSRRYRKVW